MSKSTTATASTARARLAKNLKALRLLNNKNIKRVSTELGLAYSYVYYLEKPDIPKNPSMEMLDKFAAYYDVDISILFL